MPAKYIFRTDGTDDIQGLPQAAGIKVDDTDGLLKYHDGTNIRTVSAIATVTAVADVAGSAPAGGTGAAAGGWDTAANRDLAITAINETKDQLNALLAQLRLAAVIS